MHSWRRATCPAASRVDVQLRLGPVSTAKEAHLHVRGLGAGEFPDVIASFGQLISMGDVSAHDHRVVALMHRRVREIGADLNHGGGIPPRDEALARAIACDPVLRPLLRQETVRALLPTMAWDPQIGPSAASWARIRDEIDRDEMRASFAARSGEPAQSLDRRAWALRIELALTGSLPEPEARADLTRRRRPARPPEVITGVRRGRQPGAAGRACTERLMDLRARYLELPPAEQIALANEWGHCRSWLREHADRHGVRESVAYADWKRLRTGLLAQGQLPVLNPLVDALLAGDEQAIRREKHRLRGLGQPQ